MDYLSLIRQPIEKDLTDFIALFEQSLTYDDGMLSQALSHIRQRGGKRMRPILMFLTAKNYGTVSSTTQHAAVGLELLHTASLVHDDVVDESGERRGQPSVNAIYNNKVSVLVGDYILSTALLNVAKTNNQRIIEYLAELGRTLAAGEILQLSNINNQEIRPVRPLVRWRPMPLLRKRKRRSSLDRIWVLFSRFVTIFSTITIQRK